MPALIPFPLPDHVRPVAGEPLRYWVRSRSNPGQEYLVDLEECGFNGACGCPQFQIRLMKQLRNDRHEIKNPKERPRRRCWHIAEALKFHGELLVRIQVGKRKTEI